MPNRKQPKILNNAATNLEPNQTPQQIDWGDPRATMRLENMQRQLEKMRAPDRPTDRWGGVNSTGAVAADHASAGTEPAPGQHSQEVTPDPEPAVPPEARGAGEPTHTEQTCDTTEASPSPLQDTPGQKRQTIEPLYRGFYKTRYAPDWRYAAVMRWLQTRDERYMENADDLTRRLRDVIVRTRFDFSAIDVQEEDSIVEMALGIREARDVTIGPMIEALTCGGLARREIAEMLGLEEALVATYERLVFDVRDRLRSKGYMLEVLNGRLEACFTEGIRNAEHLVWRQISYTHGADALLGYLGWEPMPPQLEKAVEALTEKARARLRLTLADTAQRSSSMDALAYMENYERKRARQQHHEEVEKLKLEVQRERAQVQREKAQLQLQTQQLKTIASLERSSTIRALQAPEDKFGMLCQLLELWIQSGNAGRPVTGRELLEELLAIGTNTRQPLPCANARSLGQLLFQHEEQLQEAFGYSFDVGHARTRTHVFEHAAQGGDSAQRSAGAITDGRSAANALAPGISK